MREQSHRPRKDLTVFLVVALLTVAVIEFYLRDLPPFMNWKAASRMGDIVSTLSLAYAASYIFHVVGDLWNKRKENEGLQLEVEENLLGVFTAFRELAKGMQEQIGQTIAKPFHFVVGDDTGLSYEWDEFLSKKGFVEHTTAQRVFRRVYYQYMAHRIELDNAKERLSGRTLVQLRDLDAILVRIKDALGTPRMNDPEENFNQEWYMNRVGDKINELHAELYFFKKYLIDKWRCKHPLLQKLLMQEHEPHNLPK